LVNCHMVEVVSGSVFQLSQEATVLLLGDPTLRDICEEVHPDEVAYSPDFQQKRNTLQATLSSFRKRQGFGRAISAIQIGWKKRAIALCVAPELLWKCGKTKNEGLVMMMYNPVITWRSCETFTMWDDCMSFPNLLVRLRRHESITVSWRDDQWNEIISERIGRSMSELLQHEIDHLDGILAVDRAEPPSLSSHPKTKTQPKSIVGDSIIFREVFNSKREFFDSLVDYTIY